VRISDVKVETSVRRWEIRFDAAVQELAPNEGYHLQAQITDGAREVKAFLSERFTATDVKKGRFAFTQPWKPEKLWDVHTPGNMYTLSLSLLNSGGELLDSFRPVRFGFREFWIDGRDFRLNGARVFCFAAPLDNAMVSAAAATYEAARESLTRLKAIGVNTVYTHNYGCQPGSHLSFADILNAADDVGMLVSFSQPHVGDYNWDAADADNTNGYAWLL
jgi:beta-galactosidase/beta-glucuronidase